MSDLNGATSARSWKCNATGGMAVEGLASMGPRARARGNTFVVASHFDGPGASMGPRARARGNSARKLPGHWPGQCFNGATSARSWKCHGYGLRAPIDSALQWGHERALVEMRPPRMELQAISRFNGATSARSWKSGNGAFRWGL